MSRAALLFAALAGCASDPCARFNGRTCIALEIDHCNCGPSTIDQVQLSGNAVPNMSALEPPTPMSTKLPVSFAVLPPQSFGGDFQIKAVGLVGGTPVGDITFQGNVSGGQHAVGHRMGSGAGDDCLCSKSGGSSWTASPSHTMVPLRAAAGTPVVVGDNGTFLKDNGNGTDWIQVGAGLTGASLKAVAGVGTFDGGFLWAVGGGDFILKIDHGTASVTKTGVANSLTGVFVEQSGGYNVWVCDDGGLILKNSDGMTWQTQQTGLATPLNAMWGSGEGANAQVWAVSNDGFVIYTRNGGQTWAHAQPFNGPLWSVWGDGKGTIYVGGAQGALLTTTDGQSYQRHTVPNAMTGPINVRGVVGGANRLYVVGDSGSIFYSLDKGNTWTPDPSGVQTTLNGIAAWSDTALVVGDDGVLLLGQHVL